MRPVPGLVLDLKDDSDLPVSYTVTDATPEQEAILGSLREFHLVNDDEVAVRSMPRPMVLGFFVPTGSA